MARTSESPAAGGPTAGALQPVAPAARSTAGARARVRPAVKWILELMAGLYRDATGGAPPRDRIRGRPDPQPSRKPFPVRWMKTSFRVAWCVATLLRPRPLRSSSVKRAGRAAVTSDTLRT